MAEINIFFLISVCMRIYFSSSHMVLVEETYGFSGGKKKKPQITQIPTDILFESV